MPSLRLPLLTTRFLSLPPPLRTLLLHHPLSAIAKRTFTHASRPASSVDPTEVSHFNALASSWWDPHGPSRLLHLMNPLRHRFIAECLQSQPDLPALLPYLPISSSSNRRKKGLKYLDVGCGGGIFAESAARLPGVSEVTAIDPSGEVLGIAKEHARRDPAVNGKLRYLNIGIEELGASNEQANRASTGSNASACVNMAGGVAIETTHPAPAQSAESAFDIVTLWEVLEHVTSPSSFLRQLTPHVAPGGWFVMSTIARTPISYITTKLFAEDILRIVPRGTHDWNKYINEPEVRGWFEAEKGWESPRCMGVLYVPGIGWREARGGERLGNYLWGIRRSPAA